MRTWLLLVALVAPLAHADGPKPDPLAGLKPGDKAAVLRITADPTCKVPRQARTAKATLPVYDFLVDHLPFTGKLVRKLELGKYVITAEKDGRILVDDKAGARARLRTLIHVSKDGKSKRLYVAEGHFLLPFDRKLSGHAVIDLRYAKTDAGVHSTADIQFRAGTYFLHRLGKSLQTVTRTVLTRKCTLFVQAAKDVSEVTHADPQRVLKVIEADPTISADLRKRFAAVALKK